MSTDVKSPFKPRREELHSLKVHAFTRQARYEHGHWQGTSVQDGGQTLAIPVGVRSSLANSHLVCALWNGVHTP